MTPISEIRNLGPVMAKRFAAVGVTSAEQLRALGADTAYAKLIAEGDRPHFIAYYALVLGLQGRPWTDLGTDEKATLRERFDALKITAVSDRVEDRLEAALNEIGVLDPERI